MKLIETYLPMDALARAAANEARAGRGAPSSLHLWWGSRQLSIARALVFAQLIEAPGFHEVEKTLHVRNVLMGLLDGDPLAEPLARKLIEESCGEDWPKVYDPMCGVGTIPYAALSLGVPACGVDLNPIAAFVANMAVGSTRSNIEEADVNRAIYRTSAELYRRMKDSYPTIKVTPSMAKDRPDIAKYVGKTLKVEMWLWARTVKDPSPASQGCQVPLVTNFVCGAKKGRESWIDIEFLKSKKDYKFVVKSGIAPEGKEKGTRLRKADFFSIFDGSPITSDYIREEGQKGRLGCRLMAIFAAGEDGEKVVLSPTKEHERIAKEARGEGAQLPLPGNVRDIAAVAYGFKTYGDLFTTRQRAMLSELGKIISEYAKLGSKEQSAAEVLALGFSQFVSWNSMSNTYWNERQFPRNTFTRQTVPFAWDFVEANPIEASTKRWEEIARGSATKFSQMERVPIGEISCADAASTSVEEKCVINTELPYYDNIAYADLADFFYAWVRPLLRDLKPEFATNIASPRKEELTAFAYRHGGRECADKFYCDGVTSALSTMKKLCREDYPSVFAFDFRSEYFSSRDIRPVAAFVEGVVTSGFAITAIWPLRDMRSSAVFGGDAGAGYRSLYFVCRPKTSKEEIVTKRCFLDVLQKRLPDGIKCYQELSRDHSESEYKALAFVSGLKIYSMFDKILNSDGSRYTVEEAISDVFKAAEEIKVEKDISEADVNLRDGVVDRLIKGENPNSVRSEIYANYLKFEDEGRPELAAQYNSILNEWNNLIEEIAK